MLNGTVGEKEQRCDDEEVSTATDLFRMLGMHRKLMESFFSFGVQTTIMLASAPPLSISCLASPSTLPGCRSPFIIAVSCLRCIILSFVESINLRQAAFSPRQRLKGASRIRTILSLAMQREDGWRLLVFCSSAEVNLVMTSSFRFNFSLASPPPPPPLRRPRAMPFRKLPFSSSISKGGLVK